jgi:DNA-binding transcriptional regulator YiaG
MQTKREHDATTEIGIPVTLFDTVREDDDGNLEIPNLDMLLTTVAVARALTPIQLVGAELRFFRHVLHLTGAEFARAIDLSDKTVVSRWENGKTRPGCYTEKIIRQLILNVLGHRAPGIEIPENAIPGMKIRQREASEGPLPMAFAFKSRSGSEGQSIDCYAEAA